MEFVNRYSDLFLAAIVVLVVGIMIIPLPTFLIDILLTINVAFGITILLVVLYISSAIKLASFPSLLLIATLFRLSLNVSTTRLILLQGDAGKMIQSFGGFVVQGNIIVGTIVFLILTLINFIVIAKGSERVAEVAARFTLDAMPGKQMAIDADLRAGAFDINEAKIRRRNLSRESQLFGAMDGAMKFVKGDAIAGIIITLVNIIGGVSVGVLMDKMDALDALHQFGLLTIGDGLLSQIPALIISSAAGLMVTRVEPEFSGDHLGKDISFQLLAHPKALAIVAILLFTLGLIPGLPVIPFWCIAIICGGFSYYLQENTHCESQRKEAIENSLDKNNDLLSFSVPAPVTLVLSQTIADILDLQDPECEFLSQIIPQIREDIYNDLGIHIPGVKVIGDSSFSSKYSYEICIVDIPVYKGVLPEDSGFIKESKERLQLISGESEGADETYPCQGTIVPKEDFRRFEEAGYRVFSGGELLGFILKHTLTKHAAEFLGLQEIKWMCDELEKYCPDTINEVIPGKISYSRFCDILRRLVQEGVSIRDLKRILETLAEFADVESDNIALTDSLRIRLGRQICHQYSWGGVLKIFLLDEELENVFKNSIQLIGTERILAMDPEAMDKVVKTFQSHFDKFKSVSLPAILTVEHSIRYVLWRFLSQQFSGIHVMSAQELPVGAQIQAVTRIKLPSFTQENC